MAQVLRIVRETIGEHNLLAPGDRVVVGVSGGPDSLCLLHVLSRLGTELGLSLHVAHLNHGLRGSEADADADAVRALAVEWGLASTVEHADVPALACQRRLAVEEAARCARYAFLGQVARAQGSHIIAVGHNADDQAETVLMHWLRGAGLAGLRGMLPSTPFADLRLLPVRDAVLPVGDLRLVRPLLSVSRSEIESYCQSHDLRPRFDRSNLDTTYFRNWLRHEVLPLLSEHNPKVKGVIRRSASVIADEYALLRQLLAQTWTSVVVEESDQWIVFELATWRALPPALQRSTLREAVHRLRHTLRDISFVHIENAVQVARDGVTGNQATLPRRLMLAVTYDRIIVADRNQAYREPDWPLLQTATRPLDVSVPGTTLIPGTEWALEVTAFKREVLPQGWADNKDQWLEYCDAEVAGPKLSVRGRQVGDRFQPLGMAGSAVKLAHFYTNQKIPQAIRDRLPLLVNPQQILWVCGQRIDHRARVQESTRQVLRLRLKRRR